MTGYKKVTPTAIAFEMSCPDCDQGIEVNLNEQNDGRSFDPADDARFVECYNCGCLIEVNGITIDSK